MTMTQSYAPAEPSRAELEGMTGIVLVEFGASWCGFCKAAEPSIRSALSEHSAVQHIKVEDGRGRPLGRSFGVKLWPTLIALRDGKEVSRVVRPPSRRAVVQLLAAAAAAESTPQECSTPTPADEDPTTSE